ncbi:helix-turn-helix domain-containing protein [Curtobacterium sp. MEB011]|uniref:helix-turn-helix domain-containing protein n=1 Tax=Curtobacterium sp. MEB011 TaxID=3040285 RepID=UPI00254ADB5A|nr:helix-turn-helix domain-containing protein [Curtobacterium sp. MEB011]
MTRESKEHLCPPGHKHGQTGTCYNQHGCRCTPCRKSRADAARNRHRAQAYGRYNRPDFVDAEPIREHIAQLRAFGLGINRIADLADVRMIQRLVYGDRAEDPTAGRVLPNRVAGDKARRILAVRPDFALVADLARIPSRGAQRRLQALVRQGWSLRHLAVRIGLGPSECSRILRTSHVSGRTHRKVTALFDELWDQTPPKTNRYELHAYNRAVAFATQNGWHPPLAWDDIDLDDRPAEALRSDSVDDMAVELAVAGEDVHLTPAERRLAVTELHSYGLTDPDIAARLHCSDRTVLRIREELDLPYNDNPYSPPATATPAAA